MNRTLTTRWSTAALAVCAALYATTPFAQQRSAPERRNVERSLSGPPAVTQTDATQRIIVKWSALGIRQKSDSLARAQKAAALTGLPLEHHHAIAADLAVLQSARALSGPALDAALQRLNADAAVEYAAPDRRRRTHALTSDPLLLEQWYLLSAQPAATRTELAWDVTRGSAATVVAVLDTGVRFDHPDLGSTGTGGKLLAGYDFVSDIAVANDGSGNDPDPADPGDWIDSADRSQAVFSGCDEKPSSWHGTRVAGLIGALTDNAVGVAGGAWDTRILPVRVLGKCGGFDSDIIAGMRWAAGLPVNAPLNPNPAKVINLSLGGPGVCTAAYQAAVDEIAARGVLVVASAGNEGGAVATPANCAGVLGVAGLRHVGTKVGFSSLGPEIGISAPGGNCVNGAGQPCLFSIVVATNTGTTTPAAATYSDQLNANFGTSFSAPLAASAAALMNAVNATLLPAQLIALLKSSATSFPFNSAVPTCHVPADSTDLQTSECNCTVGTCGAGMLNTGAAVAAALRPFGVLSITGAVESGGSITASAAGSFAANGRSLSGYAWTAIVVTGAAPVIVSPAQPQTIVQITGESQFTLRLTVTDDVGSQDVKEVTLSTPPAPVVVPPPAANNSSGGGGQIDGALLLAGLLLSARRMVRVRRRG